jgi:flagellar biosynthesis/type III secretory pathway chaperone
MSDGARASNAAPSGHAEAELERAAAHLLPIVAELEQALEAEADALRTHDVDALIFATETKRRCLREADGRLAQARRWIGLDARDGRDGVGFAPASGFDAAALPCWHELLTRLSRCRLMNQGAGAAIAALRSHTQASLRLLGAAPDPASYGSSGRAEVGAPPQKRAVC